MGVLREMHPQFFTKKSKEEREKAPKEPKKPRCPNLPNAPEKYLKNNRQVLPIELDCPSRYVSIPLSKIMEVRSQIMAEDSQINLIIQSSSGSCNSYDGCDPEVDSLYFEWYNEIEDPKYDKKFEDYQEKLKKYHTDKEQYDEKLTEYNKKIKDYKKQMKAYQLEQMKEQKARLEAQIAKAEKKNK